MYYQKEESTIEKLSGIREEKVEVGNKIPF